MPGTKRVAYFYDNEVGAYHFGFGHFMKPLRMQVTHDLVSAYGMFDKMHILRPKRATAENMTAFHTDEYVNFLQKVTPETKDALTFNGRQFLVGYDCPAFEGVFEFSSISAGGSIGAAHQLTSGAAPLAINWSGGLHHAKRHAAAGFCYINDIVLCILELLRAFPRVLYIDIDCHHGDGVEEAFYTTDRVMTVSFHKYGDDFFPQTGQMGDRGAGGGRGYSLNVPLRDGASDATFGRLFEEIIGATLDKYRPAAIVLQSGADSLAGDALCPLNLSHAGHAACLQFLLARTPTTPLVVLGGGGYTVRNTARVWTYETACALGLEKEDALNLNGVGAELPWCESFEWFGPRYRLEVKSTNVEDLNLRDGYVEEILKNARAHIADLPHAPSVHMQDTPRDPVDRHLGFRARAWTHIDREPDPDVDSDNEDAYTVEEDEARDSLDRKLAQYARTAYLATRSTAHSDPDPDPDDLCSPPRPKRRRFFAPPRDRVAVRAASGSESDAAQTEEDLYEEDY